MAYAGKHALVTLSGTGVTLSSAATTSADGITYQIAATSAQGEPFDPVGTITVNATSGAATGYTLNRLNGSVVFTSSGTRTITVSGNYLPTSTVANAHGYTYTVTADNLIATVFGNTYQARIQGVKDVGGEIQDYHATATLANTLTSSSQPLALTFHASSTTSYDARAWGFLSADDISAAVDALVDGTVSFEGSADVDGRVITFTTRGTSG